MAFNFLPNLPKADLDDRQYADLMQECLARIPRYCPEWTNHNPSDPGVVLLELFSWLTDQMLTRFNQVPRRNYVTFLELLGIRLEPPQPAQTELTFYLVANLPDRYRIPAGIEVTTERTATQAAISFSTDAPLTIGQPKIRHLLTADTADDVPGVLRDRFTNFWNRQSSGAWDGPEMMLFNEYPELGNCVYFVFEPDEPLDGNVIALTIKGEEATPTGINPSRPPRQWQAWNGHEWQAVLLSESDDQTQGFSFHELTQHGGNPIQGADVILHMPLHWPVAQFTAYQGRWLRCVYALPERDGNSSNSANSGTDEARYSNSPRIIGLMARSVGGTAPASQSALIENEVLGESQGTPGQLYPLQSKPILERREDEYIVVTPLGGLPQRWQEVADFSGSGPHDRHYVIDSVTGFVQFGPSVREPSQLRQKAELQTRYTGLLRERAGYGDAGYGGDWQRDAGGDWQGSDWQGGNRNGDGTHNALSINAFEEELRQLDELERQYGAIPPKGTKISMIRYRTGGGQLGNVRPHRLTSLKSAVPYVARVTNLHAAVGGADAESIEQAAIRVPQLLKTRDRAVTPDDFEALALQGGKGAIARARCLPPKRAGEIHLLVVPQTSIEGIENGIGISPDAFMLTPTMKTRLFNYLDDRRLLGVQIHCREPDYVGVTVQTEIVLEPQYHHGQAEAKILAQLRIALYRFLNPITGGRRGKGWEFGQALYASDIVALFQQTPGIEHIGAIQLFELRQQQAQAPNTPSQWLRLPPTSIINPGPEGLICSWADPQLRSGHIINLLR